MRDEDSTFSATIAGIEQPRAEYGHDTIPELMSDDTGRFTEYRRLFIHQLSELARGCQELEQEHRATHDAITELKAAMASAKVQAEIIQRLSVVERRCAARISMYRKIWAWVWKLALVVIGWLLSKKL